MTRLCNDEAVRWAADRKSFQNTAGLRENITYFTIHWKKNVYLDLQLLESSQEKEPIELPKEEDVEGSIKRRGRSLRSQRYSLRQKEEDGRKGRKKRMLDKAGTLDMARWMSTRLWGRDFSSRNLFLGFLLRPRMVFLMKSTDSEGSWKVLPSCLGVRATHTVSSELQTESCACEAWNCLTLTHKWGRFELINVNFFGRSLSCCSRSAIDSRIMYRVQIACGGDNSGKGSRFMMK